MRKNLLFAAVVSQCALLALLLFRSVDVAAIALTLAALVCILLLLVLGWRGAVKSVHVGKSPQFKEMDSSSSGGGEQDKGTKDHPDAVSALTTQDKETSKSYFQNYLGYISAKLGEDAANRVKGDVEAILGRETHGRIDDVLARPESRNRAKGLVVGRVQGGKTMNFTGLIARAIDEKWNIVIVLTSNNTALECQTIARLRKDLSASGLTDEKYVLIDNFLDENLPILEDVRNGKVYVGFALKQADHLRGRNGNGKGVVDWLKRNEQYLGDANIIVVDDESDNATQNSVTGASDWSDTTVLQYAESVEQEGVSDERWLRVAEWIRGLVEEDGMVSAAEQTITPLKEMLANKRIGEDDVKGVIRDYAAFLRLDRKVRFRGKDENYVGAPLLSGFVESFFTQQGTVRGRSRGDDFRAILRWLLEVRKGRSVINECITTLVAPDTFPCAKLAYVGYTATPYANFLNEQQGAENPLELDFAQSMSIAPEYFGLTRIFGKDTSTSCPRMPIVKDIPDQERDEITKPLMEDVDIGLDENLNYSYTSSETHECRTGSWGSLKRAIQWAVVAAAARRKKRYMDDIADRGDATRADRWTTMLVNLSRKVDDHSGIRDAIQRYVGCALKDANKFKSECLSLYDEFSRDISASQFSEMFPDYPHAVSDTRREVIDQNIGYIIDSHIRVIAFNSDPDNEKAYSEYIQDVPESQKLFGDWLWIVVGGNRISRGLTFDGLVSSYFDRDGVSVNVDTLTQMGRWFGYRVGYELLPRVWMPKSAVASMKEICCLEEDLHAQLHDEFDRYEDKPNPKMIAISRRLTCRDNGMRREDGVENPMVVREFFVMPTTELDGVSVVSEFLQNCGGVSKPLDEDSVKKVYGRLNKWAGVDGSVVESFIQKVACYFSRSDVKRLNDALAVAKATGMKFDVVLSNPMNGRADISLANGYVTHAHGISGKETLEDHCVRFGKFSGQYDAWKAVVPSEIVNAIERSYGSRANTREAIAEMFVRRKAIGVENRPIVQVGFIEIEGVPVPYVSVYCPGDEWMVKPRVMAGTVIDLPKTDKSVCTQSGDDNEEIIVELNRMSAELCQSEQKRPFYKKSEIWDELKRRIGAHSIPNPVKSAFANSPESYGWAQADGKDVYYPKKRFGSFDDAKQYAIEGVIDAIAKKIALLQPKEGIRVREFDEEFGLFCGIVSPGDILPPNGKFHVPQDEEGDPKIQRLKEKGVRVLLCKGPNGSHLLSAIIAS